MAAGAAGICSRDDTRACCSRLGGGAWLGACVRRLQGQTRQDRQTRIPRAGSPRGALLLLLLLLGAGWLEEFRRAEEAVLFCFVVAVGVLGEAFPAVNRVPRGVSLAGSLADRVELRIRGGGGGGAERLVSRGYIGWMEGGDDLDKEDAVG